MNQVAPPPLNTRRVAVHQHSDSATQPRRVTARWQEVIVALNACSARGDRANPRVSRHDALAGAQRTRGYQSVSATSIRSIRRDGYQLRMEPPSRPRPTSGNGGA